MLYGVPDLKLKSIPTPLRCCTTTTFYPSRYYGGRVLSSSARPYSCASHNIAGTCIIGAYTYNGMATITTLQSVRG